MRLLLKVIGASRSRSLAERQRPGYGVRALVDAMGHPLAMPVGWLGCVLLIRLVHLLLIGDGAVPFNNARLIVQAKAVVFHGIGDAFFSIPPAPNLLLASLVQILKWPAGHAFSLMCMILPSIVMVRTSLQVSILRLMQMKYQLKPMISQKMWKKPWEKN